jgi:hypothetical protein
MNLGWPYGAAEPILRLRENRVETLLQFAWLASGWWIAGLR